MRKIEPKSLRLCGRTVVAAMLAATLGCAAPTLVAFANETEGTQAPGAEESLALDEGEATDIVPVYRLYNTISGEHLYTPDANEYQVLAQGDWQQEGIAWGAPKAGTPVYRLHNWYLGAHHYTSDLNEIRELTFKENWTVDNDGLPLFYSLKDTTSVEDAYPVYRLYNHLLAQHLLTLSTYEYNVLPDSGWQQEGVAFNGIWIH